MTRTQLEFFPAAGGSSILFSTGPTATYRLLTLEGIAPVSNSPQTIKSPGQTGETAVDTIVSPRVITLQGLIQEGNSAGYWTRRAALARALVRQPVRLGETMALGRLRLTLPDRPPLELDVIPQTADFSRPAGTAGVGPVDIEFLAPYPYWREAADTRLIFETAEGGLVFGLEFPLEMTSNNVQQEVDNQGDVDAPPLIRLYGDCTTARMLNITTGQTIEISGQIESDQYIEIETAFGAKAVTLVEGTTRTSAMSRINLAKADFWSLRPGINNVKFEADTNVSGRAELFWRQRYSGV